MAAITSWRWTNWGNFDFTQVMSAESIEAMDFNTQNVTVSFMATASGDTVQSKTYSVEDDTLIEIFWDKLQELKPTLYEALLKNNISTYGSSVLSWDNGRSVKFTKMMCAKGINRKGSVGKTCSIAMKIKA
jgi:hypothetical protein